MEFRASWFRILAFTLLLIEVVSVLRCSQCTSDENGSCQQRAPPASPCKTIEERRGPVNCMIARKMDSNGTLLKFIRGCTSVVVGSGCRPQLDNTTLCYQICDSDYCNGAPRKLGSLALSVAALLAHVLLCLPS